MNQPNQCNCLLSEEWTTSPRLWDTIPVAITGINIWVHTYCIYTIHWFTDTLFRQRHITWDVMESCSNKYNSFKQSHMHILVKGTIYKFSWFYIMRCHEHPWKKGIYAAVFWVNLYSLVFYVFIVTVLMQFVYSALSYTVIDGYCM